MGHRLAAVVNARGQGAGQSWPDVLASGAARRPADRTPALAPGPALIAGARPASGEADAAATPVLLTPYLGAGA